MPDVTAAVPDLLAAELAAIRDRDQRIWNGRGNVGGLLAINDAKDDVPRLVAAVEAALALHRPDGYSLEIKPCELHSVTRISMAPTDLAAAQRACPDCRVTEYVRCWQHGCPGPWPCPTYQALAGELLSKDAGKGGTDAT